MKTRVALLGGLAAALAAGCFTSNTYHPGTGTVGDPVAITEVAGALTPTDIAVDPGSGQIVVLSPDEYAGLATLSVVDRATGAIVSTVTTGAYAMSFGMVSPGIALVSDGSAGNTRVVLATGTESLVSGMDAMTRGTPAYIDGGGDLAGEGAEGDVVSLECEPRGSGPINVFSGAGSARALVRSPRVDGLRGVFAVAYAPERDLAYAFTEDGLLSISTLTGRIVTKFTDTAMPICWPCAPVHGMAWDGATSRLLVATTGIGDGVLRIEEFQL